MNVFEKITYKGVLHTFILRLMIRMAHINPASVYNNTPNYHLAVLKQTSEAEHERHINQNFSYNIKLIK